MLEMSWITAILQLYSQVADLYGNVIVKRINIRFFDLLAQFHYILNLPRIMVIFFTCKNEEDPIKNEGARVLTRFPPL